MSNSFTNVIPKIFADYLPSLRRTARAVQVCRVDFAAQVAQKGSVISVPVPVTSSTTDVAPATTPAANTDKTPTTKSITLDQWKRSDKFYLTAQEQATFDDGTYRGAQFMEAMLAVIEGMNSYVLGKHVDFYTQVGTAATIPYGSGVGVNSTINVRKGLLNNKTPLEDLHLILDPNAEAAALGLEALTNAASRGSDLAKVSGFIGKAYGVNHWVDQQVPSHTAGTAAGTLTLGTTVPVIGSSHLYLKASSSGTLKAGDLVQVSTSSVVYSYVVTADVTTVDTTAGGIEVQVSPTVPVTHVAGDTWTLAATHVSNMGWNRGAVGLGIRPLDPSFLGVGEHVTMNDPLTGIAVTFSRIPEYMQVSYQVSALYGASTLRPEWGVRLLG